VKPKGIKGYLEFLPMKISAGGPSKYDAIRAALRGGWINTLATDVETAKWLLVNA
jgi:DNA-binding transcriptional regulator LsrR (DeoR family)